MLLSLAALAAPLAAALATASLGIVGAWARRGGGASAAPIGSMRSAQAFGALVHLGTVGGAALLAVNRAALASLESGAEGNSSTVGRVDAVSDIMQVGASTLASWGTCARRRRRSRRRRHTCRS